MTVPSQPRGLQPRRPSPWRTASLIGVHLVIAGHVLHWQLSGLTLSPVEPSEAMELVKHGIVNAGAVFFAATILLTALFGRFLCGWGCHLVALQDLCRWLLIKAGIRPRPLRSRLLGLVPLLAFLYMFVWPAVHRLATGGEALRLQTAYFTTDMWATFPGWAMAAVTLLVCGFAVIYVLGAKGYCTYGCPYGAAYAAADRLAPLRIRVTDACQGCASCTAACTSNVRVHEQVRDLGMVADPGCMKCLDCVSVCPNRALFLGFGRPAVAARARVESPAPPPRPLPWPEELVAAAAFVAAFVVVRGLYGSVPFLLSLGVAAILAVLVLTWQRLLRTDRVDLGPTRLKRDGRLRPAGRLVLGLALPVLALWGHSAWVHLETFRGHRLFHQTAPLRATVLDLDQPLARVQGEDRALVERAVAHLERADRRGLAHDPTIAPELAWLHLLEARWPAFDARLSTALADAPGATHLHLLAARARVEQQRWREAVESYQRALAADPANSTSYLGLGTLLARLGRIEQAVDVFENGLEVSPDTANLHYNLGVANALQGDLAGAILHFEACLAIDPDHVQARDNLEGARSALETVH